MALAAAAGESLMVIGGAEIYRQSLPAAAVIHLTLVHTRVPDADTHFAEWRRPEWRECERIDNAKDATNPLDYSFITLKRTR